MPKKLITLAFLMSFAAACGGPADRIKEREMQLATVTPTPGERPVGGSFVVEGTTPDGRDAYTGSLTVAPKGDNYEFRWATTKGTRIGTGVQMGNTMAVSFASTGGGKGCGVVLYKIDSDGTLKGRVARWGEETYGQERAFHSEGSNFVGKYIAAGTKANGESYSNGSLEIKKDGSGYDLEWIFSDAINALGKKMIAFGMWKGSYAAASFGGPQCSFALYDIQSNGSLQGDWGGQKQVTFGKETAKVQ